MKGKKPTIHSGDSPPSNTSHAYLYTSLQPSLTVRTVQAKPNLGMPIAARLNKHFTIGTETHTGKHDMQNAEKEGRSKNKGTT